MQEIFDNEIQWADSNFIIRYILFGLALLIVYFIYRVLVRLGLRFIRIEPGDIYERKIKNILKFLWILFSLQLILTAVQWHTFSILQYALQYTSLDWDITKTGLRIFELGNIIYGLIIFQLARLADLILTRFINVHINQQKGKNRIKKYLSNEEASRKTNLTVQYLTYGIGVLIFIKAFNLDFEILNFPGSGDNVFIFKFTNLISVVNIILIARLLISIVINVFLRKIYTSKEVDIGRQYSFNQLLTYFVYIIAVLFAFRSLGYNTTIIFGGLAALLVGVGIGLQQTFNDFFSGILLLFERSIEIGNVIQLNDDVVEVEKIGLRTSFVRNRDNIIIIVPNSVLVNGQIVNWSHLDSKARFHVEFGVAYDTDLELFEKILLAEAKKLDEILPYPAPRVNIATIAASTFNFKLYFWTQEFMPLPAIQSKLRISVINACRKHDIEMSYDQLDVRFRNEILTSKVNDNELKITPLSPDKDFSEEEKEK